MSDNGIYLALSAANAGLGALIAYTQIRYWCTHHGKYWVWIKLAYGLVGVYWSVLYVLVMLQGLGIVPAYDPVWFGRIFVRPALTVTLGMMAAGGLMRYRNGDH